MDDGQPGHASPPTTVGQLNSLAPTAGTTGVRFVRFTILGNQAPDFATDCPRCRSPAASHADLTELEVYGSPAP